VISRPTEFLVRYPRPAGIAVNPAAFGVRTPITGRFGFARLPDVTVIARLPPFAVRVELLVKHSIGSGRLRFGARIAIRCFGNDLFALGCGRRFSYRRTRRLAIGHSVLARFLTGTLVFEPLLFRVRAFRGEAVLHLAFDFGFSFLFSLLFLAGNKKRQGSEQRENGELLHGVVRPC
jgi:hypothetical protein